MIAKTTCQHCGIEFEIDGMNRTEFCPHCGKETVIVARASKPIPAPVFTQPITQLKPCADCGHQISKRAFWCPSCGSMGKSLFWKIWEIVGTFYLVTLVVGIIGFLFWKLMAMLA